MDVIIYPYSGELSWWAFVGGKNNLHSVEYYVLEIVWQWTNVLFAIARNIIIVYTLAAVDRQT